MTISPLPSLSFCVTIFYCISLFLCYRSSPSLTFAVFSDGSSDAINGMSWLRGETGEHGLHSLNFPSMGMFPWMQQRIDPSVLRNDLNHQYQAMLAAGLQNFGGGDLMKQQLLQFQTPVQYLQHAGGNNTMVQQQVLQQTVSPHMLPAQTQMLSDNLNRPAQQQVSNQNDEQQQQHTFQEAYAIQHDQLHQRQPSNLPSPSFSKTEFSDSSGKFSASVAPSSMQNVLGSLCSDGSGNLMNFSRTTQNMLNDQPPQQSWVSKFSPQVNTCSSSVSLPPYPRKDDPGQQEACGLDTHNQALYGSNIDSSALLLPTTVSSIGASSIEAGMSSLPIGDSGFQSPLYGYMQDSAELLHGAGQDSPTQTGTFVKVQDTNNVLYICLHEYSLVLFYFV